MKNICFIALDLSRLGGIEKVTSQVANELSSDFHVHVISILNGSKPCYFMLDEKVTYSYLFENDKRMIEYIIPAAFKLKKYCEKNKIDVCIFEGEGSAVVTLFLKRISNIKCFYVDHGALTYYIPAKDKKKSERLIKICSTNCDKVITLTRKGADLFSNKICNRDKIEVIPNFVEDKFFGDKQKNVDFRLLTIGRFEEQKGFDLMVKIASKLKEMSKYWHWDIYGSGELEESIKKLIISNGLEAYISIKEPVKDIEKIYKRYSLYVMTSLHEGLPMVLLEAKAAKLPIVSFDIETGPSDIILPGINGELITPFDIDEMALKIKHLVDNRDILEEYSNHAYDNIDSYRRFSVINQWIEIINKID